MVSGFDGPTRGMKLSAKKKCDGSKTEREYSYKYIGDEMNELVER